MLTCIQSLGWEDPLEEVIATHSSILAWRILMDRGVWWAIVHGVRTPGIFSRTRSERFPPQELGGGNGAPLDVIGLSCFLSSGDGYVGELIELQQGCE